MYISSTEIPLADQFHLTLVHAAEESAVCCASFRHGIRELAQSPYQKVEEVLDGVDVPHVPLLQALVQVMVDVLATACAINTTLPGVHGINHHCPDLHRIQGTGDAHRDAVLGKLAGFLEVVVDERGLHLREGDWNLLLEVLAYALGGLHRLHKLLYRLVVTHVEHIFNAFGLPDRSCDIHSSRRLRCCSRMFEAILRQLLGHPGLLALQLRHSALAVAIATEGDQLPAGQP
mmetsp:Transcript_22479/g.41375  ORF Transcript_22479/g.41375 Transcript_22479/m.41375 type:complete len:232 (-) Transcript_22479:352-1047(-)